MSYFCREAWQIPTHQLAVFLPYEERTAEEGQKAIQTTHARGRQLRKADAPPALCSQHTHFAAIPSASFLTVAWLEHF